MRAVADGLSGLVEWWFFGAFVVGALVLARDEWKQRRQASRRKRKELADRTD